MKVKLYTISDIFSDVMLKKCK